MRNNSGRMICRPRCRREPARQRHESGEYVLMRAHGQRKCAGIGAPLNEELVKSKIPAEGWRADLLVGPTTLRCVAHLRGVAPRARTCVRARTRMQARACCTLLKRRRPNRSRRWGGMHGTAWAVGRNKAAVPCSTVR